MATYHCNGLWYYVRLFFGILGLFIGVSAGISFAIIFKNYHCSAWAFVSGLYSMIVLILHIRVKKDVTFAINPVTFSHLIVVGIIGSIAGVSCFIAYLVKGILVKETGIQVHGWFIVTVWGWLTFKSAFFLSYFSKKYRQGLLDATGDILSVDPLVYDT